MFIYLFLNKGFRRVLHDHIYTSKFFDALVHFLVYKNLPILKILVFTVNNFVQISLKEDVSWCSVYEQKSKIHGNIIFYDLSSQTTSIKTCVINLIYRKKYIYIYLCVCNKSEVTKCIKILCCVTFKQNFNHISTHLFYNLSHCKWGCLRTILLFDSLVEALHLVKKQNKKTCESKMVNHALKSRSNSNRKDHMNYFWLAH